MIKLEELLAIAKDNSASDVHITVGTSPKMRIYGKLRNMNFPKLSPSDAELIIRDIMTQNQQDTLEEKGEVDFSFSIPQMGRFRVNIFKQRGSVSAAIRLVGTAIPSAQELGLPKWVRNIYNKQRGLILVVGPTGSGKSTTLAAIIDQINENTENHVITLEDPIEFLHQHKMGMVNQREIGIDASSYVQGLKAALRQDPDVIFVGELKDTKTIEMALNAAETGHLVLSTLHTIGAKNTLNRLVELFPLQQQQQIRMQLSIVLEGIVSQQLIPTINGGRVSAFEVMYKNDEIENIIKNKNLSEIIKVMKKCTDKDMMVMDEQILNLYKSGNITKENAINYALNRSEMEARLEEIGE